MWITIWISRYIYILLSNMATKPHVLNFCHIFYIFCLFLLFFPNLQWHFNVSSFSFQAFFLQNQTEAAATAKTQPKKNHSVPVNLLTKCSYLITCICSTLQQEICITSWRRENIQIFVSVDKRKLRKSEEDFHKAILWEEESNVFFTL